MSKNKNSLSITALIIGVIGLIAGIYLWYSGETLTGIAGSIASAGIAIKGFSDLQKAKNN